MSDKVALLPSISKWEIEAKQRAEISFNIPFTLENISKIEDEVARLTKLEKILNGERLEITRPVTERLKELMEAEKKCKDKAEDIKKRLLPLKKEEAAIKAKVLAKAQEIADFRTAVNLQYNQQRQKCLDAIQSKVTQIFELALKDESVDYLEAAEDTFSEYDFMPNLITFEDKEKQAIIDEKYASWKPQEYLETFKSELSNAFFNFEQAKSDKASAIEMRAAMEKIASKQNEQQATIDNAFAQVYVHKDELFEKTKELKKVWVLDEPRNLDGMAKVIATFSSCFPEGDAYYKGKDYFDVVEKIVDVLCAMRNKGVQFSGVKFVQKEII